MTPRTGPRSKFEARIAARGLTWADVAPCIWFETDDALTVDRDHPAFPGGRPRPRPTGRSPTIVATVQPRDTRTGPQRWKWLHDTLAVPVALLDRPEIERLVLALADGLEGCGCSRRWRPLVKAKPIDWSDPAQWGIDRHNDVNRHAGKPFWFDPINLPAD